MSRRPADGVLQTMLHTKWAITEDALRMMLSIVQREHETPDEIVDRLQAIAAQLGEPLDGTQRVTVRNGVATVPVLGPLFPRANLFTEVSGATSMEMLAQDFITALEDDDVRAILLAMDTPGGTVEGTKELGQLIYEARGMKPIVAQVSDMAASGGYWIGSAADEVVTTETGILGSIGVVATFVDASRARERAGIDTIEIVSSNAPKKRLDVKTKEGRADVQRILDDLEGVFVRDVGRNRGVNAKTVVSDFGSGGVLVGREAVRAGLADRLATFEETQQRLERQVGRVGRRRLRAVVAGLPPGAPAFAAAVHTAGLFPRLRVVDPQGSETVSSGSALDVLPWHLDIDIEDPAPDPGAPTGPRAAHPEVTTMDKQDGSTATAPTGPDRATIEHEARDAERKRAGAIRALCVEWAAELGDSRAELEQRLLDSGASEDDARKQVMEVVKQRTKVKSVTRIAGVHDRAEDQPWGNIGEFCAAVKTARLSPHAIDPRLRPQAAIQGASETVPSDGGFLVEKAMVDDLVRLTVQGSEILSRVRRDPITVGNGIKRNLIDETSRADGSRAGGVQGYWLDEGDTITKSKPKFRRAEWELRKVGALVYATEEELSDAPAFSAIVNREVPEELRFKVEDAIYEGDGAGKPLGALNSPALVTQAIETGQTLADGFQAENFAKMYARMHPRSLMNAAWFINIEVLPSLMTAGITYGTGGQNIFQPAGWNGQPFNTILGAQVIPIEYASAHGTVGDVTFADWSRYVMIEKASGIRAASSMHVEFLTEQMAFRFTWRVDGQTIENSPLTPFKGTATLSPFVTLAARS